MGASWSIESALSAVVIAGVVGTGYYQYSASSPDAAGSAEPSSTNKVKRERASEEKKAAPLVEPSTTIPGQFDNTPVKPKKPKKKKNPQRSSPSTTSSPPPQTQIATSIDTDSSWTRVDSRRRAGQGSEQTAIDVTTSDAGLTSSLTENSSPVEQESPDTNHATLAEKLVPKPPKTAVDDMLPPQPTLARVMRVQPLPNEKPAPGFSWGDYEDVDADGEDDGWVVQGKRPRAPKQEVVVAQPPAEETLTQRQRQNAKKRDAKKAAKAAAEVERKATLAQHKRELERIKMMEQSRTSGKGGKASGGMTPVVDDRGKLVWE